MLRDTKVVKNYGNVSLCIEGVGVLSRVCHVAELERLNGFRVFATLGMLIHLHQHCETCCGETNCMLKRAERFQRSVFYILFLVDSNGAVRVLEKWKNENGIWKEFLLLLLFLLLITWETSRTFCISENCNEA